MKILRVMLMMLYFFITSCSTIHADPAKPPLDFNPAYINQQIKLVVVKNLSAFKTNSDVAVMLEYNTENEIVFPNDYNLKLFVQQDSQWVEIKERPTVRPEESIVLSPSIPSSYGQIVGFWPQLDDLTKTYYMRIYIFGNMTTQAGIAKVAAFTDFILTP